MKDSQTINQHFPDQCRLLIISQAVWTQARLDKLGPNWLTLGWCSWNIVLKKVNFEKNPQTTNCHEKLPSMQRVIKNTNEIIVMQKLYRAKMKTSPGYSIEWSLNTQKRSQNAEKIRTSKGDYWIKQVFSSIASLFKMKFLLKERIHSQKVTHITGRLLDQAVNLFNCAPFQNGTQLVAKQRIKLYLLLVGEL